MAGIMDTARIVWMLRMMKTITNLNSEIHKESSNQPLQGKKGEQMINIISKTTNRRVETIQDEDFRIDDNKIYGKDKN